MHFIPARSGDRRMRAARRPGHPDGRRRDGDRREGHQHLGRAEAARQPRKAGAAFN